MRDTGLADRIRAKGVTVVEVAGWETRGNSTSSGGTPFQPRGAVHHHTAGSASGTVPSLNTCIYGRPDVSGPLCQVLQSREADPSKDKAYVIAAGKANHGGEGHWNNPGTGELINSNYESEGLEVEHTGSGVADMARHEISCRILAAMLEAPGSSRDHRMCCEHSEYADPDGRKVDFRELNPPFANRADGIRDRVKYWIGRTSTGEGDHPFMALTDKQQEDMRVRLVRIEKALANGGWLGSDENVANDKTMLATIDQAFTGDRGDADVRTAIVGTKGTSPEDAVTGLVEVGLQRSKSFQDLVAKVDALAAE